MMSVMFWLFVIFFRLVSHCTMFCCYRPVHCRSCFYEHKCHRPPAFVSLSVSLWGENSAVTGSSHEQLVSFRIKYGASLFELYNVLHLLSWLNERLNKLGQGVAVSAKLVKSTTHTSGYESLGSLGHRKVLSKEAFKVKNLYTADELGYFFVTSTTDATEKSGNFFCRIYCKDVFLLTHGLYEILWFFQGACLFPRDEHLRLETPRWRVFASERTFPLMKKSTDGGRRFCLLHLANVTVNMCSQRICGSTRVVQRIRTCKSSRECSPSWKFLSYELVKRLWCQVVPTASRVDIQAVWLWDEVLVSSGKHT